MNDKRDTPPAETGRRQGHSALRKVKGQEGFEVFDPHPAAEPAAPVSPPQFPEIVIRRRISEIWATAIECATLSDSEIIELVLEDVTEFIEGANWEVIRGA